ncbi:hypothetical protein K438DRAFT_1766285 [Mycena galopus ATCC 62051]|nr:hypothetical protein K438DRAFT_1766285 [Mycena galopus ATCC 62051]
MAEDAAESHDVGNSFTSAESVTFGHIFSLVYFAAETIIFSTLPTFCGQSAARNHSEPELDDGDSDVMEALQHADHVPDKNSDAGVPDAASESQCLSTQSSQITLTSTAGDRLQQLRNPWISTFNWLAHDLAGATNKTSHLARERLGNICVHLHAVSRSPGARASRPGPRSISRPATGHTARTRESGGIRCRDTKRLAPSFHSINAGVQSAIHANHLAQCWSSLFRRCLRTQRSVWGGLRTSVPSSAVCRSGSQTHKTILRARGCCAMRHLQGNHCIFALTVGYLPRRGATHGVPLESARRSSSPRLGLANSMAHVDSVPCRATCAACPLWDGRGRASSQREVTLRCNTAAARAGILRGCRSTAEELGQAYYLRGGRAKQEFWEGVYAMENETQAWWARSTNFKPELKAKEQRGTELSHSPGQILSNSRKLDESRKAIWTKSCGNRYNVMTKIASLDEDDRGRGWKVMLVTSKARTDLRNRRLMGLWWM